ncbi:MAG: PmoA family protein, partial [Verrucomicrobiales bacterium]|nr:PmoA family protein [Verrucomicrobiales bacterium]
DHHHHRGLFWAWPHVGIGGKNHDLWALSGIEQRHERWLARETLPNAARLGVENGWYVGDRRVMQERVWLTVHPADATGRAIDVDATWMPTTEPVTLAGAEGKSYGGLTLRYAPRTDTVITTPLGNGTNDLYITRLPWADLSARFAPATESSGIALFVAPDHPDYPPTWLTRHYGVLCLGWPGVEPRTFQPGSPVRVRYRAWIHRGTPSVDTLARAYGAYTNELAHAEVDAATTRGLRATVEPDRIRVAIDGKTFTEYRYSEDLKLPRFHPLIGPRSQRGVTAQNAEPYPHHASLWFGCDRVNGGNYGQEGLDRGRIRSLGVRLVDDGRTTGTAIFEQDCLWERPGAEPPFRDHRLVRVSAPSPERRQIDFEITLVALTDVRVEKSNHSLFSARMAPDLTPAGGGRLINAEGDSGEKATFGKPSAWMDSRGPRGDGLTEGLTLVPAPTNPGHPAPWFTRDYGFLSPTTMFWLESGERRFAKGETLRLRYRVLVHADGPSVEELSAYAKAW